MPVSAGSNRLCVYILIQFSADLVTFTEEILNEHFIFRVVITQDKLIYIKTLILIAQQIMIWILSSEINYCQYKSNQFGTWFG